MKTTIYTFLLTATFALAQGPETPPGVPGPTQKSLQEIWDTIAEMQTVIVSQEAEIKRLRDGNRDLLRLLPEVGAAGGFDVFLNFASETVDSLGNVGANPSMAYDSSGQIVIAYEDHSNFRIRLARANPSGSWTFYTVATLVQNGSEPSLAIDSNGKPWIAFRDNAAATLKVATTSDFNNNSPSGNPPVWTVSTVDADGDTGSNPSLVIRTPTRIGIAYRDNTNARLKYASYNGLFWSTEAVPKIGADCGVNPSLAFNPTGTPVISYHDVGNSSIELAAKPGSSWTLTGIERAFATATTSALSYDYSGRLVCAYRTTTDIYFAVFNGSSWDKETTGGTPSPTSNIAMAINGENLPIIAYTDILGYSKVISKYSTGWARGRFPQVPNGSSLAVVVGPFGLPLVAFHETQGNDLILSTPRHYEFQPSNP